jgi:putative MATE family efflux protein
MDDPGTPIAQKGAAETGESAHDQAAVPTGRRLRATLREALRGGHRDYTTGSIPRAIFLLAVPMVFEMAMESLFALVNVFWVSHLGPAQASVVGVTESLLAILYAVAMGLAMSATATVARRIGEKDRDAAARAAVQVLALGVVVAVPIAIVGGLFARRMLGWMDLSAPTVAEHGTYAVTMFGGNATILLLFLLNAIFRGAGDASTAMKSLFLANGINLLLDPCLIFGLGPFPELGVTGSAIATNIGRGTGVLFQLVMLWRGRGHIGVRREHLRIFPAQMLTILRLSGVGILQMLIMTASWTFVVRVITGFGEDATAGYLIGMRIVVFGLLPSWGMSNAAATLVGQNLGAGKPDRAERSVWLAGFYNMIFLAFVGAVFVIGAPWIVRGFTDHPDVARSGVACLRIVSSGFLFYAYGMVLTQAFNGAGDTWTPTWINFFVYWLWEIPLAIALAHWLELGPRGVYIAIAVAFSTFAVVGAIFFRRGRWKTRRV